MMRQPDSTTAMVTSATLLTDRLGPADAAQSPLQPADPVLCEHCGRTASNGISCQGSCVADSGY
jgi:hypothetical protein